MNVFFRMVNGLAVGSKWIGVVTMSFVMFFITISVLTRAFGAPILGSVEIVQLCMVVMIMFGLAYTQSQNSHITIDLLVDKMPQKVQHMLMLLSNSCLVIVCFIISWVMFDIAYRNMVDEYRTTMLLGIPLYPFKFIICIGYALWGLGAIVNVWKNITALTRKEQGG